MVRLRSNFEVGTVTNNPLTSGGLTLTSTELASVPVVASPDILAITIDPEGAGGQPEIVHVTDHAASATSATIIRGREGTIGREHASTTPWVNALTAQDIDDLYDQIDTVTAALPNYLPLTGGTMLGDLVLAAAPDADLEASTKKYVDDQLDTVALDWDSLTGKPTQFPPTDHNHDAGDIVSGTVAFARLPTGTSASQVAVGNHPHSYAPVHSHPYVDTGGDTMTGSLGLPNGSQGTPAIRGSDANTGLYFGGASLFAAISVNGLGKLVAYTNRVEIIDALDVLGNATAEALYLTVPLSTSNNGLPGWRHNTSAGSSGWEMMRLVSSLRYKRNIHVVDADQLVEELRVAAGKLISWEDKESPEDSPRYMGISAEDAYEIVPNAVALDEKGRPESVEPANAFSVHLIAAVAQLLDRVDQLEVSNLSEM